MKYDDGFIAYLNGTLIASRNAPAVAQWLAGPALPISAREAGRVCARFAVEVQ